MIVVTGAAGFIGSRISARLCEEGHRDLILVDDFSRNDKTPNHIGLNVHSRIHRNECFSALEGFRGEIRFFLHLGARTDTTEQNEGVFDRLNLGFSQQVWQFCARNRIPLIYASSAATYGAGENGFSDDLSLLSRLRPLNPYGASKHRFDMWALAQQDSPPWWAGLKFFNVFGPNESHKGRMASVVFHAFRQIRETGSLRLFRSHRPDIADGHQQRDFIYVRDVEDVIRWMMDHRPGGKIFNLGTGKARTFLDLGNAAFMALGLKPDIRWTDTPADIRAAYQYFTEAPMQKLSNAGYSAPFTSLEEGIRDYACQMGFAY